MAKLEWVEVSAGEWEADFCLGMLTLKANNSGWSLMDDVDVLEEDNFYTSRGEEWSGVIHGQQMAESALKRRLLRCAEDLDSDWLCVDRPEEEQPSLYEDRNFHVESFSPTITYVQGRQLAKGFNWPLIHDFDWKLWTPAPTWKVTWSQPHEPSDLPLPLDTKPTGYTDILLSIQTEAKDIKL